MVKRTEGLIIAAIAIAIIATFLLAFFYLFIIPVNSATPPACPYGDELQDPAGYYDPYSPVQVGRNGAANITLGTNFSIVSKQGYTLADCMTCYHAVRCLWFLTWICYCHYGFVPRIATYENALMIVRFAMAWGKDYRLAIPTLMFESTFYEGSPSNPYGELRASYHSFEAATWHFFQNLATNPAYAGCGNNPYAIASVYNSPHPDYWRNFYNIFQACDGGDGSGRTL